MSDMDLQKKESSKKEDILFSRSVKAGQRIYYIDVKENNRQEMYLSITESKKVNNEGQRDGRPSFEKHKIFLFKEDFEHFTQSLLEAIHFVVEEQPGAESRPISGEITIDMDF